MRVVTRIAIAGLLVLAAAPAHADAEHCAAGDLNLWPLYQREGCAAAGRRTTRVLGPLFERWERTDADPEAPSAELGGWTLRPLLARVDRNAGYDLEFLHPLGEWRVRPDRTRLRLTPLADRTVRHDEAANGRQGWTFGPAFGGTTDEGERYGGIFPLGGIARERFGRERVEFWLFPLFGRSRDERGFTRTHLLWPFFSWGSGGGRELLRIWPFYGHDRREASEHRFALWPVFHWRRDRRGTPQETHTRLALPFWGEARSARVHQRFVLGPLWLASDDAGSGARSRDLLWPFLHASERPGADGETATTALRIEPFWRQADGPGFARRGALFGGVDWLRAEDGVHRREATRLFFVSRFERSEDRERDSLRVRRDLWPLFSLRERTLAGESERSLLAPWPLPVRGGGFERHALGLTTLYEERTLEGETRIDALWGLYRRTGRTGDAP